MQRRKGQAGERELAGIIRDLTGWDVKRRVRNNLGDDDLEGVPGWSVESKRYAKATPALIRGWWDQAVRQAGTSIPVLFFRENRSEWRAVWPLAVALRIQSADMWVGFEWTATTSIAAWAAVAREIDIDAQNNVSC